MVLYEFSIVLKVFALRRIDENSILCIVWYLETMKLHSKSSADSVLGPTFLPDDCFCVRNKHIRFEKTTKKCRNENYRFSPFQRMSGNLLTPFEPREPTSNVCDFFLQNKSRVGAGMTQLFNKCQNPYHRFPKCPQKYLPTFFETDNSLCNDISKHKKNKFFMCSLLQLLPPHHNLKCL